MKTFFKKLHDGIEWACAIGSLAILAALYVGGCIMLLVVIWQKRATIAEWLLNALLAIVSVPLSIAEGIAAMGPVVLLLIVIAALLYGIMRKLDGRRS